MLYSGRRSWSCRSVPNCRSFRILCQWMEKKGILQMNRERETVYIT